MVAWQRTFIGAVTLLLTLGASLRAAEPKPAVVISLANADQLLDDVAYLTQAVERPDAGRLATLVARPYLNGVDRTQPAGAYITFDGDEPRVVGFVAVKDITLVIATLKDQLGDAQAVGDDGWSFPGLFLKQQGEWTFAAMQEAHVKDLPKDPLALLKGLEKQYSVAALVSPAQFPDSLKKVFLDSFNSSFKEAREAAGTSNPAELMMQNYMIDAMSMMVKDTQEVLLGWKIDAKGKQTQLDFHIDAQPETALAKRLAVTLPAHPSLHGFDLPGAAMYVRRTNAMSPDEQKMIQTLMETARTEGEKLNDDPTLPAEERAKRKSRAEAALPLLKIMKSAKYLDQAIVGFVDGEEVSGVFGMSLAADSDWRKLVSNLVEQAKKDDDGTKFEVEFDAAKIGNVALHRLTVESEEDAIVNLFGETQHYTIGTAPGVVYFAVGKEGENKLKQILAAKNSGEMEEVYLVRVAAKPFVRLASERFHQPIAEALLEKLDEKNDKLLIVSSAEKNRLSVKTTVDEGVLRAIGGAIAELIGANAGL
jgi:hypothetical protein